MKMRLKNLILMSFLLGIMILFLNENVTAKELACDDYIDNDGDGAIDCYDEDCYEWYTENDANACQEDTDCADNHFCNPIGCCIVAYEYPQYTCDDGLDNDHDDLMDCHDDDCETICPHHEYACDDGLDNDMDYHIDCEDSDCADKSACIELEDDFEDDSETPAIEECKISKISPIEELKSTTETCSERCEKAFNGEGFCSKAELSAYFEGEFKTVESDCNRPFKEDNNIQIADSGYIECTCCLETAEENIYDGMYEGVFAPGAKSNNTMLYLVITVIVIAGIGGYIYYTKKK